MTTELLQDLTLRARLRKNEGRFEDAISLLGQCADAAKRLGSTEAEASALLETGRLYLLLGRVERAFQAWDKMAPASQLRVALLAGLSDGFAQAAELAKAERLAEESIVAVEEIPESETASPAFIQLMADRRFAAAALAERQGQFHRALYYLQGIENNTRLALERVDSERGLSLRSQAGAVAPTLDLMRGRALAGLHEWSPARESLERSWSSAQARGDVATAVQALACHGRLELRLGEWHKAVELLATAVDKAEDWLADFEMEEFRTSMRIGLGDAYTALVIAAKNDRRLELAWKTVERARSREFLAAIRTQRSGTVTLGTDLDRLEELTRRISALTTELLESGESPGSGRIREQRNSLLDQKARHIEAMRHVPRKLSLVHPPEESWSRIAELVGHDTAFVQFFFTSSQLLVFVVVDGGMRCATFDAHPVAVGRRVRRLVSALAIHPVQRKSESWRALASQLYDGLWAPLTGVLAGKSRVCIVPHGPLSDLPFAALCLPNGEPLLANTEIVYAPSASILTAITDEPAPLRSGVAVFADPLRDPIWSLPGTRAEAEAIRETRLDAEVHYGAEATPAAVIEAGKTAGVLHLACHADFDSRYPLLSALLLAGDKDEVARLEAHAIYGEAFVSRLVVLSACQSARIDRHPSGELQGLLRAFIVSGAGAVIGSQWNVDDIATAELMSELYGGLAASTPPGTALRAAQLTLATSSSYADPYFWAAFGLHGDWR